MKKFYLVSLIINLALIFSILNLSHYFTEIVCLSFDSKESLLGKLYFISDFKFVVIFFGVFFSTISPLAIYVAKNYKYHWLLFLIITLFITGLYFLYWYKSMDILQELVLVLYLHKSEQVLPLLVSRF